MGIKNPMSGVKGGYNPKTAGYGLENKGMPKGTMVNKGNGFPGKAGFSGHGSYTPNTAWSGVVGKK